MILASYHVNFLVSFGRFLEAKMKKNMLTNYLNSYCHWSKIFLVETFEFLTKLLLSSIMLLLDVFILFVALCNSLFSLSFLFYLAKYMSQKGDNLVVQALLQLTCFLVKFPTWSFEFFNKFKMALIKCHLLFSSCVWAYFSYGKVRKYWLHLISRFCL